MPVLLTVLSTVLGPVPLVSSTGLCKFSFVVLVTLFLCFLCVLVRWFKMVPCKSDSVVVFLDSLFSS